MLQNLFFKFVHSHLSQPKSILEVWSIWDRASSSTPPTAADSLRSVQPPNDQKHIGKAWRRWKQSRPEVDTDDHSIIWVPNEDDQVDAGEDDEMRTMVTRRTRKPRMARLPICMFDAFKGNNSTGVQSQCAARVHILIKLRQVLVTLQVHLLSRTTFDWSWSFFKASWPLHTEVIPLYCWSTCTFAFAWDQFQK